MSERIGRHEGREFRMPPSPNMYVGKDNLPGAHMRREWAMGVSPFGSPQEYTDLRKLYSQREDDPNLEYKSVDVSRAQRFVRQWRGLSENTPVIFGGGGSHRLLKELIALLPVPPEKSQLLVVPPVFTEPVNFVFSNRKEIRKPDGSIEISPSSMTVGAVGGELPLGTSLSDRLEHAIKRRKDSKYQRVLAYYICDPGTPMGESAQPQVMKRFIETAQFYGDYVIIDRVLGGLLPRSDSLMEMVQDNERLMFVDSMSKIIGLPMLRVGWAVVSEDIAERVRRLKLVFDMTPEQQFYANHLLDPQILYRHFNGYDEIVGGETRRVEGVREKTVRMNVKLMNAVEAAGLKVLPTDLRTPILTIQGPDTNFYSKIVALDIDVVAGGDFAIKGVYDGIDNSCVRITIPKDESKIPEITRMLAGAAKAVRLGIRREGPGDMETTKEEIDLANLADENPRSQVNLRE